MRTEAMDGYLPRGGATKRKGVTITSSARLTTGDTRNDSEHVTKISICFRDGMKSGIARIERCRCSGLWFNETGAIQTKYALIQAKGLGTVSWNRRADSTMDGKFCREPERFY